MGHIVEPWIRFCERVGAQGEPGASLQLLIQAYNQPERFYHTLCGHISDCLNDFWLVRHFCDDPLAVEAAIWFHDVIYDTQKQDNEKNSAIYAKNFLTEIMQAEIISCLLKNKAYQLIILSKHVDKPITIDEFIMIDIDLAILGKSEAEFDIYEQNIREEYAWVNEQQFNQARTQILTQFLKQKPLYHHPFFQNRYGHQAKINLGRSIKKLND